MSYELLLSLRTSAPCVACILKVHLSPRVAYFWMDTCPMCCLHSESAPVPSPVSLTSGWKPAQCVACILRMHLSPCVAPAPCVACILRGHLSPRAAYFWMNTCPMCCLYSESAPVSSCYSCPRCCLHSESAPVPSCRLLLDEHLPHVLLTF